MCGIAGIIQKNAEDYHLDHLKIMTGSLSHRGPDGEALWQNETNTVLLGHRRLAVIDLSPAANQPMHYKNKYHIVYNGEIYNYIELRQELIKQGYHFQSQSDTEVILAAYDFYKDTCPEKLDGMFAFAIWDEVKQELFAARDRFGEKPFFYTLHNNNFLFSSEMKALWRTDIPRSVNLKMLFNFITIGYTDNPENSSETFFNNIYKLPAAAILIYSPVTNKVIIEKYWDIDTTAENRKIKESEAIEEFSALFTRSVKKRFRSDVPVGTSLSGGLDSSSIVAFSQSINEASNSHKCFTAIFPGFEKDEKKYAEKVAAAFSLQHFMVSMTANELADDFEKLIYHQEEPFGSSGIFAQYKVYELAKKQGIKSLLDGQGADELLAGYSKYYKWYWQELFHKRKLLRSREINYARQKGVKEKFGIENIIAALFPGVATVFLEHQYLLHAMQHKDLTTEFVYAQSREAYYSTPAIFGLNGALYFNTCIHGLEELLRYADRNSMAHGCEVRLPFLDHHLAEFIFSLPANLKIHKGWTKWLLRKAIDKKIPGEITWRTDKTGFEPPQQQWMKNEKLQELIFEAKKKMVTEKILKPEVLNKPVATLSAYATGNYDWRYLTAGYVL